MEEEDEMVQITPEQIAQMTPEQMTELMEIQTIKTNKLYMNRLRKTLDYIEELDKKPDKDRLGYANIISQLIAILITSIKGWQNWLNFNSMDNLLSLEEMQEIAPKMKNIVKEWIEMDLLITEAKTTNIEKQCKERKAKKAKSSKSYLS